VAGDPALIKRFTALRKKLIGQVRDKDKLLNDIVDMREKMRAHLDKPKHAAQLVNNVSVQTFNVKQSRGGIVDIEFLVQYLVLANGLAYPRLADWTDNIRLIKVLSEVGLLSEQEAEQLTVAYQDYRAAAHLSALKQQKETASVDTFAIYQQQVSQLWARFFTPS
jgi:glutamate-ammonia-ligase adenylyltransferase